MAGCAFALTCNVAPTPTSFGPTVSVRGNDKSVWNVSTVSVPDPPVNVTGLDGNTTETDAPGSPVNVNPAGVNPGAPLINVTPPVAVLIPTGLMVAVPTAPDKIAPKLKSDVFVICRLAITFVVAEKLTDCADAADANPRPTTTTARTTVFRNQRTRSSNVICFSFL